MEQKDEMDSQSVEWKKELEFQMSYEESQKSFMKFFGQNMINLMRLNFYWII